MKVIVLLFTGASSVLALLWMILAVALFAGSARLSTSASMLEAALLAFGEAVFIVALVNGVRFARDALSRAGALSVIGSFSGTAVFVVWILIANSD